MSETKLVKPSKNLNIARRNSLNRFKNQFQNGFKVLKLFKPSNNLLIHTYYFEAL